MLSEETIKEFQELYKKKYNIDLPHDEAAESARNLIGFVKLCCDLSEEEAQRKKKLEEFPKGFKLDGVGYTCHICGRGTLAGENWYDKYGIKCSVCQASINRKEIPGSLAKNHESWYSKYDLESRFNITAPVLRSWIKKGLLKPRTVTTENKRPYYQLFLIKDNKDFLPPKKMTESQSVKETRDGKEWHHFEPWYRFVDPYEHLKGYKIMDHVEFVKSDK